MSRARHSTTLASLGVLLLVAGCATRGALNSGLAEQQAALDAAIEAERQERIAADQQVQGEVQQVAGNVDQLRMDLAALDEDFGVKIAQLEEGLQLAVPVHFAFDDADVRPEANDVLDRFTAIVQNYYPSSMITVEGFTDPAGPPEYNRQLAQRRADAVRDELIGRGLPESQLRAVSYGEDRPVVPSAAGTAYGAEMNRRVAFVIETSGDNVLGTPFDTDGPSNTDGPSTPTDGPSTPTDGPSTPTDGPSTDSAPR